MKIVKGDILNMSDFEDSSFDLVRSDITLQHVDLEKALKEVHRVLKPGGRLLTLEGGDSNTFSSDSYIIDIYDKVLPPRRQAGRSCHTTQLCPA